MFPLVGNRNGRAYKGPFNLDGVLRTRVCLKCEDMTVNAASYTVAGTVRICVVHGCALYMRLMKRFFVQTRWRLIAQAYCVLVIFRYSIKDELTHII